MGDRLYLALIKAIAALDKAGIEYALIGGFAAAVRGRLRFTQDLDVLSICPIEGRQAVVDAFRGQGFAHMDRADRHRLDEVDLLRFWLPVEDSAISIGVDLQVSRREHLEAAVRRARVEIYQGIKLRVATREDLILLKLSAWRPIDRADAIELTAVAPETLDWTYLELQSDKQGLTERLAEIRQFLS